MPNVPKNPPGLMGLLPGQALPRDVRIAQPRTEATQGVRALGVDGVGTEGIIGPLPPMGNQEPAQKGRAGLEAGGYFHLAEPTDPALERSAVAAWDALVDTLGLSVRNEPPRTLGADDLASLDRLTQALGRLQTAESSEHTSDLREALRGEWLGKALSPFQLATRVELGLDTGYLLMDAGPLADNPRDHTGWSDQDLSEARELLEKLPPMLRFVPGLSYLVRDARSVDEDEALSRLAQELAAKHPTSLPGKVLVGAAKAMVSLLEKAHMGFSFGTAWFGSKEVRLYGELFAGSRIPGLQRMLAYTTIHEIAHHLLRNDPKVWQAWSDFYERGILKGEVGKPGKEEAPNGYARGSIDEGFGVALGMYAVAPKELQRRSPRTFEFFQAMFSDTLVPFNGHAFEPAAIDFIYGLGDVLVALLTKKNDPPVVAQ